MGKENENVHFLPPIPSISFPLSPPFPPPYPLHSLPPIPSISFPLSPPFPSPYPLHSLPPIPSIHFPLSPPFTSPYPLHSLSPYPLHSLPPISSIHFPLSPPFTSPHPLHSLPHQLFCGVIDMLRKSLTLSGIMTVGVTVPLIDCTNNKQTKQNYKYQHTYVHIVTNLRFASPEINCHCSLKIMSNR